MFLNQFSRKILKSPYVFGYPIHASVEATNLCNLNCPMCSTNKEFSQRKRGRLEFGNFKKVIDELGQYLYVVGPFNLGEPLLHDRIFDMIAYAEKKNVATILSTNGNLMSKEISGKMIDSGLEKLTISLDAASRETHDKNRPGGNFGQVINNIKLLVSEKKKRKSSRPFISLMMIVMKNNEQEIGAFKKLARELGVDKCVLTAYWEQKLGDSAGERSSVLLKPGGDHCTEELDPDLVVTDTCRWAWSGSVINWDGNVVPCCFDYNETYVIGNIRQQSFKTIWNNERYRMLRKNIKRGRKNPQLCARCPIAERTRN
jgi:radical SAM protein with 4Fe4S-binding SPASM domain